MRLSLNSLAAAAALSLSAAAASIPPSIETGFRGPTPPMGRGRYPGPVRPAGSKLARKFAKNAERAARRAR